MLRNRNVSAGGRRVLGTPNVGILAATIASETFGGDQGPGLLYDEASNPANAGKQLRIDITTLPGDGDLFVYENGAFDFDGAANGTYTIGYDWYADDVLGGSDTATIVVGAADGSAAGATLTGTSSLSAGTATGGTSTVNGSASGATLAGASSLSAGAATGAAAGTAPGAVLSGASGISTGSASGEVNTTVAGATVTGTSTLAAGQPSASNAAPGAALATGSDLSPGTATGNTALGANLTGASSIFAGGASGASAAVVTNRRRNKR